MGVSLLGKVLHRCYLDAAGGHPLLQLLMVTVVLVTWCYVGGVDSSGDCLLAFAPLRGWLSAVCGVDGDCVGFLVLVLRFLSLYFS